MRKDTLSSVASNRFTTKLPRILRSVGVVSIISALLLLATFLATAQTAKSPKKRDTELFKGKKVAARQVLVKFRDFATAQDVEKAKKNIDSDLDKKVGGTGVRLLRSRSKDTTTLINELSARSDVLYVEPDYVITVTATPNDSSFSQVWGLQNTGQVVGSSAGTPGADISASSAWDISTGSPANVVAVVDTGVDYDHPDLAANMWSAPIPFFVTIGGQTIRCEAGTHGFNAITKTCDPMDEYGHGTHVAGTIGAAGNNGEGVTGVNWTSSIMAVKFMDATGSGTLSDAIDAIEFTIQAKATFAGGANVRVLSNSWGWNGESSQALLDQIKRAAGSEMLFVAGAGNGGGDYVSDDNDAMPFYPASYDAPNVISVAATDNQDMLASFSNYGEGSVDLGAPGVLVLSTTLGGGYDWWSGTSMATPHVSGAAALVLSKCALDTTALKSAILNNVDSTSSLAGITATGGRLNLNKALRSCASMSTAPTIELANIYDGITYPTYSSVVLQANASDIDGTVSRVDYYVNGKFVSTAQGSPYSTHWYATEVGEYMVTGVATDNTGMSTTSRPVKVIINETIIPEPDPAPTPNQAPTISLTTPSNGSTYIAPATLTINANASDSDGTISEVQFYSNNQLVGIDATTPYSFTLSNIVAGSYSLQAVAIDNGGISVGSNVVSVTVEPAKVPTATTDPASNVASTTAQLNGAVNPNGSTAKVWFEWGTSSSLNSFNSTPQLSIGSGSTVQIANANVSGLAPGATYFYRLATSNDVGISKGSVSSFTTTLKNIQVTVQASPSGRSFIVDGTTYTSAQTFTWTSGSTHTISTTSVQSGATGAQYVWSNWNDGGALSHTITPGSNTTYTANFTTQYFLTMNAISGGTAYPTSGWYNSGQTLSISATANDGSSFNGWTGSGTGSYTGSNNPANVTMNGPITEKASFTARSNPLPAAVTQAAISITANGATLNGSVNPNGSATNVVFEWGTSSNLTTFNSTPRQAIGSSNTSIGVSANLNGLNPSTTYYFRVVGSNSTGTSRGGILSFTTSHPQPAQLTSPANGSTFNSSSATFTWSPVAGASQYFLDLNSSPGSRDIYADYVTNGSTTISGIPTDGRTIYVRLWSNINGTWLFNEYIFKAFTGPSNHTALAQITSPTTGSTFTSSTVTFTWNTGIGASQYFLDLNSSPGSRDIYADYVTNGSTTISGIPTDGRTIYVRLWSNINGTWLFNDYNYKVCTGCYGINTNIAQLTSPADGSTFSSSTMTFIWSPVAGASQYFLDLNSSPGSRDIYADYVTNGSTTVSGIPKDGRTIYVRLWSNINGTWLFNEYRYTAMH